MTFAMVPDAAWPGLDQWPWSTAPATSPVGRLARPSASDSGGFDRCVLSLCGARCVCLCDVLAHLAPVNRCARPLYFVRSVRGHLALVHRCPRCVRYACAVCGFVPPLPPPFFLGVLCFFFLLCLSFFKKWKRGCVHTAGRGMGNRCSGAVVLRSPVSVVVALLVVAPEGCGSRFLMYTGVGQGGFC